MHLLGRRDFIASAASVTCGASWAMRARADQALMGTRISVADFGAFPDGSDSGPGVRQAIARLPKTGGATLYFPPGAYRFAQKDGVAMRIEGVDDFVLDGTGAHFLFQGKTQPIVLVNCRHPAVHGFSIDWPRPPFSQGEVIALDAPARTVDIRIDPEFPVDGSEPVQTLATYDREAGLMALGGVDAYGVAKGVSLIGHQVLRLELTRILPLKPGDTVVLRHQVYSSVGIALHRCVRPNVRDVSIFAMPGMGITGNLSSDIKVSGVTIMPTPGTSRLMSLCADGIHFASCSGSVDIENCSMTAMGDDGVNVHGVYLRLMQRVDSRTATVARRGNIPFNSGDLPADGDSFSISSAATLESIGDDKEMASEAGPTETLHFAADIPAAARPGDLLIDSSVQPKLTITACAFLGNRARGVLVHSDALVEKCIFRNQFEEAILILPDASWMEGPAGDRVTVRENVIEGTQRGGRQSGAIKIGAIVQPNSGRPIESAGIVNHDLEIAENDINNPGGTAIMAYCTDELRIVGNRISQPTGIPILLGRVNRGLVAENTCRPAGKLVLMDCEMVVSRGNSGLD